MVCRSSRATSKRPFFMAIMALSKSSLSGCLEFTPASGLALRSSCFFFLGFFSLAWAETDPSDQNRQSHRGNLHRQPVHTTSLRQCSWAPAIRHFAIFSNFTRLTRLLACGFAGRSQQRARIPLRMPGAEDGSYRPPAAPLLLGRPGPPYREPRRRPLRF